MNENNASFLKDFMKWLAPNKPPKELKAKDAYLQAKYNRIESKEDWYKKLMNNINELIISSCQINKYYCTIEFPLELVNDYLLETIEKLSNDGYTVIDMREHTKMEHCVLFITWNNNEWFK